MSPVPQVRGSACPPFAQFLDDIGASIGGSPAEALLPAMVHQDPETLIPNQLAHAFLNRNAHSAGLTDLGFVIGQPMQVDGLGAFGLASPVARQCVPSRLRDLVRLAAGDAEAMRKTFRGADIRQSEFVGIAIPAPFLSLPWTWPRILSLRGGKRDDTAFKSSAN